MHCIKNFSENASDDSDVSMTSNICSDSSPVDNTYNNLDTGLYIAAVENNKITEKQGLSGADSRQSSGFDAGNTPSE